MPPTDQLPRMRGMLYGYSDRCHRRIRDWAIASITRLVIAAAGLPVVRRVRSFAYSGEAAGIGGASLAEPQILG